MKNVTIIAAVAKNGVIGKENDIPWHLPLDLKQFKTKTMGCPMIMGRKTWESFGSKPLPKRPHIVISSKDMTFENDQVQHAHNIETAIVKAKQLAAGSDIYIIGGQTIYEQAMDFADRMFITHVDLEVDGDRYFPTFSEKNWKPVAQVVINNDKHPFTIVEYVSKRF